MSNRNNNSSIPNLVDTHCHIHEAEYPGGGQAALERARTEGVEKLICVGTDEITSQQAVEFVAEHENCWASVGLHPHDAVHGVKGIEQLASLLASDAAQNHRFPAKPRRFTNSESPPRETRAFAGEGGSGDITRKIVAIGECGLDYFYEHSPREQQVEMLHTQIKLALEHNLPMIFHVRDAFDDFWPIFDQYQGLQGVVHSFTDSQENLEKAIDRGLYIGVNGIATFTKVEVQTRMYANIPLEKLLLETDAPFLTPTPYRGTVNEPAFVKHVATYLADLRHIPLEELSAVTSKNANTLFSI